MMTSSPWDVFDTLRPPTPPPPERPPVVYAAGGADSDDPRAKRWAEVKLAAQAEELAAMPPKSGRNQTLNAMAYSLGRLAPKWLDPSDIFDYLITACHTNGLVAEDGLRATEESLKSGLNKGMTVPRDPPIDPERGDVDDWLRELPKVEAVDRDAPWEQPEPLTLKVPPFPTHVFGWLEPTVIELADHLQTPVDIIAMLTFATVSATVRGRAVVRISDTWTEPLNIYVAAIAGAGETKSPALAVITRPLRDLEARMQDEAAPEVAAAEQARRLQEGRVAKAEKVAVNATGDERRMAEEDARREVETLMGMQSRPVPRLLAADVTAEGLVRLLAEQDGAIAALSAEGGLFDTLAGGRYSNGMANLDAVLQAHDGREPILVDRKVGPPLRVESPCLTLGLAVQPQVLQAAGGSEAAVGRGFLARFLYSVPESRVGTRRMRRAAIKGGFDAFDRVVRVVDDLLTRPAEPQEQDFVNFVNVSLKDELRLSLSSTDTFYDYLTALEPRRHPISGDLGGPGIGAWANKMDGQLARLAALLQLIYLAETSTKLTEPLPDVPVSTVVAACEVADYLIGHAVVAHKLMAGEALANSNVAVKLLDWVRRQGLAEFTVRDAHRALSGQTVFKKAEVVHEAATVLATHGYLRPVIEPKAGPGRRTERYLVNPLGMED